MANAYTALHGRDRRGGGSGAEGVASAPPHVKSPKKNDESALFETIGRSRPWQFRNEGEGVFRDRFRRAAELALEVQRGR